MTKVISTVKRCTFVMLCLFLCSKTYANKDDKKQLLSYINLYQHYLLKNQFESAAKEAQHAYELSQKLYKPSNENHLIIAEEYALILLQIEKYKQAVPILQCIIKTIENKYSVHDKRLIPILDDLKIATKSINSELSKEYELRQMSLYLRYNNEYVNNSSKQ